MPRAKRDIPPLASANTCGGTGKPQASLAVRFSISASRACCDKCWFESGDYLAAGAFGLGDACPAPGMPWSWFG